MPPQNRNLLSPRLRMLLEIHNGRFTRLQPLAERLGVSVQAVSEGLRRLRREGMVHDRDGSWKPTPEGTEWLHTHVRQLKQFVDGAQGALAMIDECVALAAGPIRSGASVGLFMDAGHLWARQAMTTRSTGTARSDAVKGGLVRVDELSGIVELRPGRILVVSHPQRPTQAASRRLRQRVERNRQAILAGHDTSSRALANELGRTLALEFAPTEATIDAARRGIDVVYLVPRARTPDVLAVLAHAKDAQGDPIKVRSVEH